MQHTIKSKLYSSALLLSFTACSDSTQFTPGTNPIAVAAPAEETANSEAKETVSSDATEAGADRIESSEESKQEQFPVAQSTATIAPSSESFNASDTPTVSQSKIDSYRQQCSQGNKKTIVQKIKFPETANCRFSEAGNLTRRNGYLQAIEGQMSTIVLPEKSQLCNLELSTPSTTIQYDDFMVVTLNGYVLLSSNTAMLSNLEGSASSAYKWNFARIQGIPVDFNAPAYCLGDSSSLCVVPETDVPGKFQFNIDPSSLISLADKIIDTNRLEFSLIATGDNDDRDCWHTELSLDFTLQYVEQIQ